MPIKDNPQKDSVKSIIQKMSTSTKIIVGIVVFLIILVMIYAIVMFEFYKSKTFIFKPYKLTPLQPNSFYPLGTITQLTQEQINARNALINASLKSK